MFLEGIALEQSEVWRNEQIRGLADVPALLQANGGLRTEFVDLQAIGAPAVYAARMSSAPAGKTVLNLVREDYEPVRRVLFYV